MGDYQHTAWPAWYYGPNGESDIFDSAPEVPAGWQDHPSKHQKHPAGAVEGAAAGVSTVQGEPLTKADPGKASDKGEAPIKPTQTINPGGHPDESAGRDVDAEGWPWSGDLHASTRAITKTGLWRMKVGVSRPAPKPGFPKPALDL